MAPPPPRPSLAPPPPPANLGPKSKTKQFFWDKTQVNADGTVWGQNKDLKNEIKFDDLDEVFSNTTVKPENKGYQPVK